MCVIDPIDPFIPTFDTMVFINLDFGISTPQLYITNGAKTYVFRNTFLAIAYPYA